MVETVEANCILQALFFVTPMRAAADGSNFNPT